VQSLTEEVEATRSSLGELQTVHDALRRDVSTRSAAEELRWLHLGFVSALVLTLFIGIGGWFVPVVPEPERIVVSVESDDAPHTPSGSTPFDEVVDPKTVGQVTMLGGTISLRGEQDVFGSGALPPGTYRAIARPLRGPDQDLGVVTVHAGEALKFQCAAGVCARIVE
jgi:hypothetical protein